MSRTAVVQVPLRWSDQDAYGHLNNARAVTLLEEARIGFLWTATGADSSSFRDGLIVAGLEVDYRRQVRFRAATTLRIVMTVGEVRAVSFRIHYDVHDGPGEDSPLAIRASTRMAMFDLENQRLRRLTDAEVAYLHGTAELPSGVAS